jgi:NAD(P)-dependent dehydrogenase (short-subunit alcohol dehydrogenase family)
VALVDIKAEKGEKVAAEIRESGGEARFFACDLIKMADVEAVIAAIDWHFGQIDVLYNNAGYLAAGTVETLPESAWDRMFTSTSRPNIWSAASSCRSSGAAAGAARSSTSRPRAA